MDFPLTLASFAFLLLIICVGYVFVEALGSKYNHKVISEHISERYLQYIIRGIFSQIVSLYLISKAGELGKYTSGLLTHSEKIAELIPG